MSINLPINNFNIPPIIPILDQYFTLPHLLCSESQLSVRSPSKVLIECQESEFSLSQSEFSLSFSEVLAVLVLVKSEQSEQSPSSPSKKKSSKSYSSFGLVLVKSEQQSEQSEQSPSSPSKKKVLSPIPLLGQSQ